MIAIVKIPNSQTVGREAAANGAVHDDFDSLLIRYLSGESLLLLVVACVLAAGVGRENVK